MDKIQELYQKREELEKAYRRACQEMYEAAKIYGSELAGSSDTMVRLQSEIEKIDKEIIYREH